MGEETISPNSLVTLIVKLKVSYPSVSLNSSSSTTPMTQTVHSLPIIPFSKSLNGIKKDTLQLNSSLLITKEDHDVVEPDDDEKEEQVEENSLKQWWDVKGNKCEPVHAPFYPAVRNPFLVG